MDNGELRSARKARYLITALWADTFDFPFSILNSQFSINLPLKFIAQCVRTWYNFEVIKK